MYLFKNRSFIPEPLLKTINELSPTIKGVLLALVSTGMFVSVGVLVRMLSGSINVFQILLFRQLVFIVLLLPAIISSRHILMKGQNVKLHSFRISGAFFALYFGFLTVSNIPFADATALGFTQVLFVAVISQLFLSERVGVMRIITIIVGFIGVHWGDVGGAIKL